MKKGFIYILSNNSLKENLFKIGKTSKSTSQRIKQLSSSTSIPESFEILHEFEFSDLNWAEREVHKELDKYRYNRKKEFFNCEIEIAKSAILKIQVIDKENQINLLKSNLEIAKKTINSNEFIKSKWSYFLNNIQWNFKEQNFLNSKSEPDFIIETKDWFGQSNEETQEDEIIIFDKKTLVFVVPNLDFEETNFDIIQNIKEIQSQITENNRLLIVSNKPFTTLNEIYIGWKYEFHYRVWEKCKFIETKINFGLFEENQTWFCFVNGIFLTKENLWPEPKKIIELWK
ncbi:conserved hypothetical protein [Flavobacterium psychrophilum]|uniref:GIY-YIG nuclease family protein n=1 Tax=Flavobacterium psychrophilum TaxID=96345 RepID=UPI000B7C2A28|nr:GIY-YIG nuclease family protein [Flavobacterium psychrophilum]SNB31228.1 conserved hypothetical protein [Flavobacterium psychrophilum]